MIDNEEFYPDTQALKPGRPRQVSERSVSSSVMPKAPAEIDLTIAGLHCQTEANHVETLLSSFEFVKAVQIDLAEKRVKLTVEGQSSNQSTILDALRQRGFPSEIREDRNAPTPTSADSSVSRIIWTAGVFLLIVAGFVFHLLTSQSLASAVKGVIAWETPFQFLPVLCYALAIAIDGWRVVAKAVVSLRSYRADMHVLIALAVIGAIVLGMWFEAALLVWLFSISLTIESFVVKRARQSVQSLMKLVPASSLVWSSEANDWRDKDTNAIDVGDRVMIKPGQRVPVDGQVIVGQSAIDESILTGEMLPREVDQGEQVRSGTINGAGLIEIVAQARADNSTLAQITALTSQAVNQRSPTVALIDRLASYYTPIMIAFAIAAAIVPPLTLGESWSESFRLALILLVIGCPCAFVIATPVAMLAAISAAAKKGLVIRGGTAVEAMARVKAIAFDKTGTLTQGKPTVIDWLPTVPEHSRDHLIAARALARRNDHPLSQAIVRYVEHREDFPTLDDEPKVEAFESMPGFGVCAIVNGRRFRMGSQAFVQMTPDDAEFASKGSASANQSKEDDSQSHVFLAGEDGGEARFVIEDSPRPELKQTINLLRGQGIRHIAIISGDRQGATAQMGQSIDADEVVGEALPSDKLERIASIRKRFGPVAMVGDGINDGPSLAASDVSLAFSASASDLAMDSADILITQNRPIGIPQLIHHSKWTLRVILQNLAIALAVKLIVVTITWFGWGTLWLALMADSGTTILVVLNALRLTRFVQ